MTTSVVEYYIVLCNVCAYARAYVQKEPNTFSLKYDIFIQKCESIV